jgi:hypothetical protein
MQSPTVGFVGGGRITAILLEALGEHQVALERDRALRAMLDGAVRTFFDAGLTAEQVLDLVPVKLLAEAEPQIRQAYLDVLPRLHAKLKGA